MPLERLSVVTLPKCARSLNSLLFFIFPLPVACLALTCFGSGGAGAFQQWPRGDSQGSACAFDIACPSQAFVPFLGIEA